MLNIKWIQITLYATNQKNPFFFYLKRSNWFLLKFRQGVQIILDSFGPNFNSPFQSGFPFAPSKYPLLSKHSIRSTHSGQGCKTRIADSSFSMKLGSPPSDSSLLWLHIRSSTSLEMELRLGNEANVLARLNKWRGWGAERVATFTHRRTGKEHLWCERGSTVSFNPHHPTLLNTNKWFGLSLGIQYTLFFISNDAPYTILKMIHHITDLLLLPKLAKANLLNKF